MFSWCWQKIVIFHGWLKSLMPKWLQRLDKQHPRTIGILVVVLLALPGTPILWILLHLFTWLFTMVVSTK